MTASGPAPRAAVIVHPVKTDAARLRAALAVEEARSGWAPSLWFETSADDPGTEAARAALAEQPSVVIVSGGDGTIRAVAQELHPTGIPLALVPAGTGNLLARNLGLLSDLETAVRTAFVGGVRPVDVGLAGLTDVHGVTTSSAFVVMAGVGLDARMATDTDERWKRRLGWLAYADPISRSVIRNAQFRVHYRVDHARERAVEAHTVIVGNCSTLTAGFVLLPEAVPDDGRLDVVLLRPRGFWQWLRVGWRLGIGAVLHRSRRGRVILRSAPGLRALQYLQARTLTARFEEPQQVELDGDAFGEVTAVRITLHPGGLGIRIPNL